MGDVRYELRLSVGNSEVKRPLGRPDSMWKDTIKMDFKILECEVLDYIQLAQGRCQWCSV
jgi:hypothetical protein